MDEKVERQKAHFDRIASRYQESRRHRNHLQLKRLMWSDFLGGKEALRDRELIVLEAMCGFADGKSILEEHTSCSIVYKGFDYSEAVVKTLRREDPDVEVWQQDVTKFQSDETFDLILVLGGLHHVPHAAESVVPRLAANLRAGGYFIVLEPTFGNPIFQFVRNRIYRRNELFDDETERAFSVSELMNFFDSAGLELVDVTFPGLLSYVLYYNPDAFPLLNIGTPLWVRTLWAIERPLLRTRLARALSFATLGMWRKPVPE